MSGGIYGGVVRFVAIASCIILCSGLGGWWLANLTAPRYTESSNGQDDIAGDGTESAPSAGASTPEVAPEPPVYFLAHTHRGADLELVQSEMRMAADAGIHRFIVSAALPWSENETEALISHVAALAEVDPEGRLVIDLELDPPSSWLSQHPDDAIVINDAPQPYASPASDAWRTEVASTLTALATLATHKSIAGVLLAGFEGGAWVLPEEWDASRATMEGFSEWLTTRYGTDEELRRVWGDTSVSLASPALPGPVGEAASGIEPRSFTPESDFARYRSESIAGAIVEFAEAVKSGNSELDVWVRYGCTFSAERATSGAFALGTVLTSRIDTVAYPAAAIDRGLGGVGGYAGPIQSILNHGKQCVLIDDTFTGIEKSIETGKLEHVRGMSYETVANVYRRNFASAIVQGVGIAWADPEGDGRLHDADLWEDLAGMRSAYARWLEAQQRNEVSLTPVPGPPFPPGGEGIDVVVDEANRLADDYGIQSELIGSVVGAALRAGAGVNFWLLDDYLATQVQPAPLVLFSNLFSVSDEMRGLIHARLAQRGAAAVWMYAPGETGTDAAAETSVSDLVRMTVTRAAETSTSGSVYALDSQFIRSGETFGGGDSPAPRYAVDDANADVLATYASNGRTSVAIATTEDGWASVFVGEARMSPPLLRELMQIFDIHSVSRSADPASANAYYVGPGLLAFHTVDDTDIRLEFGSAYDVENAVDASQGWRHKTSLVFHPNAHETRLFMLSPADSMGVEGIADDDVPPVSGSDPGPGTSGPPEGGDTTG